jgi:hypothetical protein
MSRRHSLLAILAVVTLLASLPAFAASPVVAAGSADLAVTMIGNAKHLKYGQTITFTATVTNLGPDAAGGVTLGIGVSDSYANFGGVCPDGSVSNICSLGTLPPGARVTVLFSAGACCSCCPEGIGVAVASVFSDATTVDPVAANDSVRIETKFVGKAPF